MKKMKTGIGVMLALLCCILMCTGVVYATADSTEHMPSVAAAAGQMSQEAVSGAEVERKEDGRENHLKISRKEAFRAMMANRRLERKKRMEAYAIKPRYQQQLFHARYGRRHDGRRWRRNADGPIGGRHGTGNHVGFTKYN